VELEVLKVPPDVLSLVSYGHVVYVSLRKGRHCVRMEMRANERVLGVNCWYGYGWKVVSCVCLWFCL